MSAPGTPPAAAAAASSCTTTLNDCLLWKAQEPRSGGRLRQRRQRSRVMSMGQRVSTGVKSGNRNLGDGSTFAKNGFDGDFLAQDTPPARLDHLLSTPAPPLPMQYHHAWNATDRSLNIFILPTNPLTLHRHPVAQSTDAIRSRNAYSRGLHAFAIHWPRAQRGTHAIIGVATSEAPLHAVGYQALVGGNAESWGWDIGRCRLLHEGAPCGVYPLINQHTSHNPLIEPLPPLFTVPDEFILIMDMDEGTVSYAVVTDSEGEGEGHQQQWHYLGVAFRELKGRRLHVCVSAVWGHCEISMRYLGGIEPEPLPLMDLCRRVIRQRLTAGNITYRNIRAIAPSSTSTTTTTSTTASNSTSSSGPSNGSNSNASATVSGNNNNNVKHTQQQQQQQKKYKNLNDKVATLALPVALQNYILYGRRQ